MAKWTTGSRLVKFTNVAVFFLHVFSHTQTDFSAIAKAVDDLSSSEPRPSGHWPSATVISWP